MKGLLCVDRVSVYIAEGRAGKIVDPDHGANVTTKIEKLRRKGGTEQAHPNLAKVPKCPAAVAPGWTSNLSKLPCFLFRTILLHFTERAELEVDEGECCAADADGSEETGSPMEDNSGADSRWPPPCVCTSKFRSFRSLNKVIVFF